MCLLLHWYVFIHWIKSSSHQQLLLFQLHWPYNCPIHSSSNAFPTSSNARCPCYPTLLHLHWYRESAMYPHNPCHNFHHHSSNVHIRTLHHPTKNVLHPFPITTTHSVHIVTHNPPRSYLLLPTPPYLMPPDLSQTRKPCFPTRNTTCPQFGRLFTPNCNNCIYFKNMDY